MSATTVAIDLAERGIVPEAILRAGIRAIVRRRLDAESQAERPLDAWLDVMRQSPVAIETRAANDQHYEVPAAFYELVLGPHLKYSGAFWPDGVRTLADAESAMLDMTMDRARLADGHRILELGCGWGSLTRAMAGRYPGATIHAVSNSASQRTYILDRARTEGMTNIAVETRDMNVFAAPGRFDRVVSVEMFEHMRNWPELLRRIRGWLADDGALFVHVFSHVRYAYPYDIAGDDDWMARHFFTGGMMPSDDLLPRAAEPWFRLDEHWQIDGTHYARTAEAWHDLLLSHRDRILEVLTAVAGRAEAARLFHRWRLFLLACAELFAFRRGREWIVSHYRLVPR